MNSPILDVERCHRAVESRDRRFDGVFYPAVRTTGIYCRPSCPARPHRANVVFYVTAAAAQAAGFRACKRCLPDATPGSPEWDIKADVAGRAMRLINDGMVEREGVEGLAARLGYSPRHLNRLLVQEVGASPLALARARRAQAARILIETTTMTFTDAAFASGFASIRQFNDTVHDVYATTPSQLRAKRARDRTHTRTQPTAETGRLVLKLAAREPFDGPALLGFLAARAVAGIESVEGETYRRTMSLSHGSGQVALTMRPDHVECVLQVADLRDVTSAVERCRRLLDADSDPVAVQEHLGADELLAPLVAKRPGLRVPGHVDGFEIAVRAVLGQQVSVAGARTVAGRLVMLYGRRIDHADGDLTHLFPDPQTLAGIDPTTLPIPQARARALIELSAAVADGRVVLDRSADRAEVERALLNLPGIGPWTAGYVAMRALGDTDVFLPTDIGVRNALRQLGADPKRAHDSAESWRPWRSYALMHLWTSLSPAVGPAAAAVPKITKIA